MANHDRKCGRCLPEESYGECREVTMKEIGAAKFKEQCFALLD